MCPPRQLTKKVRVAARRAAPVALRVARRRRDGPALPAGLALEHGSKLRSVNHSHADKSEHEQQCAAFDGMPGVLEHLEGHTTAGEAFNHRHNRLTPFFCPAGSLSALALSVRPRRPLWRALHPTVEVATDCRLRWCPLRAKLGQARLGQLTKRHALDSLVDKPSYLFIGNYLRRGTWAVLCPPGQREFRDCLRFHRLLIRPRAPPRGDPARNFSGNAPGFAEGLSGGWRKPPFIPL